MGEKIERSRSLTAMASSSPFAKEGGYQITVHTVQDVYSNAPLFVKIAVGGKKTRTDKSVKGARASFEEKMVFSTWEKTEFAIVSVCKEKKLSRPVVGVVKIPFPIAPGRYSRQFPLVPDEASHELGGECGRIHLTVVDLKEFKPTKYDVVDTAVADLYEGSNLGGDDLRKEVPLVEMPTLKFPRHTNEKDFDYMCILGRGGFGKVVQVRYKRPEELKWATIEETKNSSSSNSSKDPEKKEPWACKACSFMNVSGRLSCEMCKAAPPSLSRAPTPTSSPTNAKSDSKENVSKPTTATATTTSAAVTATTTANTHESIPHPPGIRLYPRLSRTRHTCTFYISTIIQERLAHCPSLRSLLSYHAPQVTLTLNSFDFLAALSVVPQSELRILCGDDNKNNTAAAAATATASAAEEVMIKWEVEDYNLIQRTAQALQWCLVEEAESEPFYAEPRGLAPLLRYLCSGFCSSQTQKAFGPLLEMNEKHVSEVLFASAMSKSEPSDLERTYDLKKGNPRSNQATAHVRENANKLINKFSNNIKALIGEDNPTRARFNDLLLSLFRQVGNRNTALGIFISEPTNFAIYSAELWRQFSWPPEDLVGVELLPPNETELIRNACDTFVKKLVPDLPTLVGTHLQQSQFEIRVKEILNKVGKEQPQLGEFFLNEQHSSHYINALWRIYTNVDSEEIFEQNLKEYEHRVQMKPLREFFLPLTTASTSSSSSSLRDQEQGNGNNTPVTTSTSSSPTATAAATAAAAAIAHVPVRHVLPSGTPPRHFALKIIEKAKVHDDLDVMDEVKTMIEMKGHPFVCQLYYHWQTKDTLNMLIELVTHGTLEKIIKMWKNHPDHGKKSLTFTREQIVRIWTAEIVMALSAMHDKGIIYRDLKPDNVLLDENGHVRLIDLGIAYKVTNDISEADTANKQKLPDSVIGGAGWKAPEMLKKGAYNHGVDAWSLGLLIYYLLSGKHAFDSSMFYNRDKSAVKFTGPTGGFFDKIKGVSNNCKHLLGRLLQPDPTARLGAGKFGAREIMRHPFFGAIDWDLLTEQRVKGIRLVPEAHANTKTHALLVSDDAKPEFGSLKETMEGIDQRDIQLQLALQAGIE